MKALLATSALVATALAAPVFAQEVLSGDTGVTLKFSGQVNRGLLITDDGEDTDTFFVDNDNSSTRIRFQGEGEVSDDVKVGTNIEVQFESNSTADVNQIDGSVGEDSFTQRKLELYFHSDTFGRITLGQGDTASNGTSEVDLSGTSVVGYSGVADFAGGLLFRDTDGALTDINIGSVFSNLDGLSRRDRLRYDSPVFGGVSLAASAIEEEQYDVALLYGDDLGAFRVEGAVAWSVQTDDDEIVNGSLSVLHRDSGLSLTLAGGEEDRETDDLEPQFGYVKLGYQTDNLTSLGKSAFAVDYYEGEEFGRSSDESTSYGLQFVQKIDKVGTEIYAGVRQYEYDAPGVDVDDVTGFLLGARIKF